MDSKQPTLKFYNVFEDCIVRDMAAELAMSKGPLYQYREFRGVSQQSPLLQPDTHAALEARKCQYPLPRSPQPQADDWPPPVA